MDIDNIVILAAGRGTRLGGERPYPKALAELSPGLTIMDWQLKMVRQVLPYNPITAVVGYGAEYVMASHPELDYVYSEQYATQNTAKSLLLALQHVKGTTLWLNGDVVFSAKVLPLLLADEGSRLLVNSAAVGEEEVKYRTENGLIVELSKEVKDAEGESLGINVVTADMVPLLLTKLEQCAQTDYFEKGIQLAIAEGAHFGVVAVGEGECVEVDFPTDLERARELVKMKNEK